VAYAQVPLAAARIAARAQGATVNDALLAATALAVGRAHARRGAAPGEPRALVPVDLRAGAGGLGNRLSFLPVALPAGERDPAAVLARVREQTTLAKAGGHAAPLAALARAGELLPRAARRAVAEAAVRLAAPGVIVSNLRGPAAPLHLLGRRVTAAFPAVPLLAGQALSLGALSYRGRLHLGLLADARTVPDVAEVAADLAAALRALAYQSVSKSSSVASAWTASSPRTQRSRPAGSTEAAATQASGTNGIQMRSTSAFVKPATAATSTTAPSARPAERRIQSARIA
jgi:hypothetical protein